MMNRRRHLETLLLLAAGFFGMTTAAAAAEPAAGKILKVGENLLVVIEGKEKVSYTVSETTKISLDGKPVLLEKLRPGMPVKVKATEKGGKRIAESIAARAVKNPPE